LSFGKRQLREDARESNPRESKPRESKWRAAIVELGKEAGIAVGVVLLIGATVLWLMWPSESVVLYRGCMDKLGTQPHAAHACRMAVAGRLAREAAVAACVSHESKTIRKCELSKSADQVQWGDDTDVKIITYIQYRDDWNDFHTGTYTVRLIRSGDNWRITNTQFVIHRGGLDLVLP
jgi:hypothetical protein